MHHWYSLSIVNPSSIIHIFWPLDPGKKWSSSSAFRDAVDWASAAGSKPEGWVVNLEVWEANSGDFRSIREFFLLYLSGEYPNDLKYNQSKKFSLQQNEFFFVIASIK